MNHFYAHADAGEPAVRLNDRNPEEPFVVVDFGSDWDFTSHHPDWCRRVASTWTAAADLLDAAQAAEPREDYRHAEPDLEAGQ